MALQAEGVTGRVNGTGAMAVPAAAAPIIEMKLRRLISGMRSPVV
ncbi:MAG: hypothetical protein WKF60_00745 [Ilumatobacter sp.]